MSVPSLEESQNLFQLPGAQKGKQVLTLLVVLVEFVNEQQKALLPDGVQSLNGREAHVGWPSLGHRLGQF